MPEIRRSKLPQPLLVHLLTRMRQRGISHDQIVLLARWLDTGPVVPESKWFKRFAGFTVCGEGELIKTFLLPGQAPDGQELST
jgi:ribosomal protein S18 acetylase RimI-like enzyme